MKLASPSPWTSFGSCQQITITKDETTIVDGGGVKAEIEARWLRIRVRSKRPHPTTTKEKLQERLAKLAGGVAVISALVHDRIESQKRKDRVDDALNATRAGRSRRYRGWRRVLPSSKLARSLDASERCQ